MYQCNMVIKLYVCIIKFSCGYNGHLELKFLAIPGLRKLN